MTLNIQCIQKTRSLFTNLTKNKNLSNWTAISTIRLVRKLYVLGENKRIFEKERIKKKFKKFILKFFSFLLKFYFPNRMVQSALRYSIFFNEIFQYTGQQI